MNLEQDFGLLIVAPDASIAEQTQALLDKKTKPPKSLGRLEEIACTMATIRNTPIPSLPNKATVIMAADHGITEEGVSAFPSEVTAQMVANFDSGGAAVNVLSRWANSSIEVVDMGVGTGTANFTKGPAMSKTQALDAIRCGISKARELSAKGITLVALGDMGIGNTTPSSAIASVLLGRSPVDVTWRGTGIDDEGIKRKVECIARGLEINQADKNDPIDVLAKVGGLEIAGLVGLTLGCCAERIVVVLDGLITTAAALVASRMHPEVSKYLIASHESAEIGHKLMLKDLGLTPLLSLGLCLGEASGAVLAMGIIDASIRILHEMATFESAGVSNASD